MAAHNFLITVSVSNGGHGATERHKRPFDVSTQTHDVSTKLYDASKKTCEVCTKAYDVSTKAYDVSTKASTKAMTSVQRPMTSGKRHTTSVQKLTTSVQRLTTSVQRSRQYKGHHDVSTRFTLLVQRPMAFHIWIDRHICQCCMLHQILKSQCQSIMIILAAIFTAQYLTDKGERFVLYWINKNIHMKPQ